tara:strand:- start:359 stop:805 length:447 start_codon:yes stop_codon:yes gene_type:complete
MLDIRFFKKLRKDVIPKVRRHIFIDAKDVHSKSFSKDYSEPYKTLKKQGKLPRQGRKGKLNAPFVSGDLRNDFQPLELSNSHCAFGWKVWGGRVKKLEKQGRILTEDGKALPKKIEKFVMSEAREYAQKELDKVGKDFKGKKFKIRVF